MLRLLPLVLVAALAGAVSGRALQGGGESETRDTREGAAIAALESRLDEISQRLDRSEADRALLASQVAALEPEAGRRAVPQRRAAPERPELPERREDGSTARRTRPRFDREALVAAGFEPREVDRYRARLDDIELRRLYLRDQATREGWIGTPRYTDESRALFRELAGTREEFGDELYDWSLYTTGHPNRVRVSEVMEGSPAAEAGLESGDLLVGYADQRILNPMELRELTTTGEAGEFTPIDVLRGDEELRVYVPRGPLGVQLDTITREPEPAR